MNILQNISIELPGKSAGSSYQVSLAQVRDAHELLHEGCPVTHESECLPLEYSRLVDERTLNALERAWQEVEKLASASGGRLLLHAPAATQKRG